MEIKYLEVLLMPNGEILNKGKTIGYINNLEKYIKKEKDILKDSFVKYLVDNDIRNDNGLKSLFDLFTEYPQEWDNFIEDLIAS
jgi:ferritin